MDARTLCLSKSGMRGRSRIRFHLLLKNLEQHLRRFPGEGDAVLQMRRSTPLDLPSKPLTAIGLVAFFEKSFQLLDRSVYFRVMPVIASTPAELVSSPALGEEKAEEDRCAVDGAAKAPGLTEPSAETPHVAEIHGNAERLAEGQQHRFGAVKASFSKEFLRLACDRFGGQGGHALLPRRIRKALVHYPRLLSPEPDSRRIVEDVPREGLALEELDSSAPLRILFSW